MDIKGEYKITSSRQRVWAALIDPEVLKECIPGCESMERISDTEFTARIAAAVGPVRAKFDTRLQLENINAPESYTLIGDGKGGAAGFGRGSANVKLVENGGITLLTYDADFKVGGKLAQVGSRLVLSATKKTADDFFGNFSRRLDPEAQRIDVEGEGRIRSKTWIVLLAALAALLVWWFLLR